MGNLLFVPCGVMLTALYPAFESYKCLEYGGENYDSGKWLTYWIIFAAVYCTHELLGFLLEWFPFYHIAKTSFLCGCAYFGGATYIYNRYMKPYLAMREAQIDSGLEVSRGWLGGKIKGATQKATLAGKHYLQNNSEEIKQYFDDSSHSNTGGLTGSLGDDI